MGLAHWRRIGLRAFLGIGKGAQLAGFAENDRAGINPHQYNVADDGVALLIALGGGVSLSDERARSACLAAGKCAHEFEAERCRRECGRGRDGFRCLYFGPHELHARQRAEVVGGRRGCSRERGEFFLPFSSGVIELLI